MDPLRVILQEYPVAGLEIGERSLRLVLLALKTPEKQRVPKPKKEKGAKTAPTQNVLTPSRPPAPPQSTQPAIQIAALAEEALPEGVIGGGVIRKPELLVQALTRLRRRAQNASRYVIASVPADIIYTRVFTFPGTISGKRLEETMQLTAGFQLPKAPEEMYLDWEEAKSKRDEKAVLLAMAPRNIVDGYLKALDAAGFRTVALEHHLLSITRSLPKSDDVMLFTVSEPSSMTVAILVAGEIRFMRTIPKTNAEGAELEKELEKISEFAEASFGPIARRLALPGEMTLPDIVTQDRRTRDHAAEWLASTGAALRGLLPRRDDTLVSILPVGTEEAYERQKMLAFAGLLANLTIGVTTVIAAGFLVVWSLLGFLQQQAIEQPGLTVALSPETREALGRAERLNALLGLAAPLTESMPRYSTILAALGETVPSGIRLTEVRMASLEAEFQIGGNAADRTALTTFRDQLEESALFSGATLPLADISQRENIPFTLTVRLEDPSATLGYSE